MWTQKTLVLTGISLFPLPFLLKEDNEISPSSPTGIEGVQLRRKVAFEGVSFVRIQKYTNDTLPLLRKDNYSLGLDVLMVADYSTLQGFIEMSGGDVHVGEMYTLEYLKALFEQVKTIYEEIEIGKQIIHLNLVGTFVVLREDDCPLLSVLDSPGEGDFVNTTSFDNTTIGFADEETNSTVMTLSVPAIEALDRFTYWLKKHDQYLTKHDYATLITKFDLLSHRGDSDTQGMAYVGNVCKLQDSASVVEDVGAAATAIIAAHELGHSLGAFHDGSPAAKECPSSDNYLMASTVSGSQDLERFAHSRLMSSCSTKSIEKNLGLPDAYCLRKPSSPNRKLMKKFVKPHDINRTPGEIIGPSQQCQITFGPQYGVCPNREYFRGTDLCHRIWCKDRTQKRSEPCETKTYFPALDGTECGATKWCIAGQCVDNPKRLQECVNLNEKTCRIYSKVKLRHYCKAKDFKEICCLSCSRLKDL